MLTLSPVATRVYGPACRITPEAGRISGRLSLVYQVSENTIRAPSLAAVGVCDILNGFFSPSRDIELPGEAYPRARTQAVGEHVLDLHAAAGQGHLDKFRGNRNSEQ